MDKLYKSKVDWWLGLLMIALLIYGLVAFAMGIYLSFTDKPDLWLMGGGLFVVILIFGFAWPVNYTLTSDTLVIRFGVFRSKILLSDITGAKPSKNPLSSPALSLDRLEVRYNKKLGFVIISPADKEAFMQDIAERTSHLEYINGELRTKN